MRSEQTSLQIFKLLQAIGITIASIFVCWNSGTAHAEKGAVQVINRAGTSINRGNLSRDARYPTYSLAINIALKSSQEGFGVEISNGFRVSHSTFYTLNPEALKFPVIARAPYQMLEAAYVADLCFFSYTYIRPCFAVGLSSIYLRHDAANYQLYSAFPAESRLQVALRTGLLVEFGARIRRFSARFNGTSAWTQDVTGFVGMGITFL